MFDVFGKKRTLTTGKATGAGQDPSCCIVGGHGEAVYGAGVGKERREEARQLSSGYVCMVS